MAKLLAALLLMMVAIGPACAVAPTSRADTVAALDRYRSDFAKIRGYGSLSTADRNYVLFSDAMRRVLTEHVKPFDPQVLIDKAEDGLKKKKAENPRASDRMLTEAALDGMLGSLDPYSSFLDSERYRYLREQTQGEFGGLGIEVTMDEDSGLIKVVSPIDGSPAARAGLRSGDLIARIDDMAVKGLNLHDAVARMRGPVGSSVALSIRRPPATDANTRVSLTRAIVKIQPVRYRLEGNVAYVRIATFNQSTSTALDAAVEDMRRQSRGRLIGAVIDLRNNPGGLLEQAVQVADRFLETVDIVSVRGRDPEESRSYRGTSGDLLAGLPVVVLINSGSASASEIVAGALQDHHRALLFGSRSYGKGSVQTISSLSSDTGIRLTTARYYRPSGALVDCFGVSPNLEVKPTHGSTEESHPDPATCDANAPVPPKPQVWMVADMCPDVMDKAPKPDDDRPLECAVSAIRNRLTGTLAGGE
ncbi:carboxyl-terminal protease [Azospirillum thiophilum]|uniref:Carboxyl-terminal protease n=1 Tax=Azospirillum thiophilum TaxID=528244 RepID=A0AAC8W2X9_9PROT|nr:S41 family peptidase [Azospirillum thiophilum]ALG74103.1 carboxyl-terminal protease [Azospirillum thiophilum]KJR63557.1 carboxyl-terminal protease [Azospirillum thiophilum]